MALLLSFSFRWLNWVSTSWGWANDPWLLSRQAAVRMVVCSTFNGSDAAYSESNWPTGLIPPCYVMSYRCSSARSAWSQKVSGLITITILWPTFKGDYFCWCFSGITTLPQWLQCVNGWLLKNCIVTKDIIHVYAVESRVQTIKNVLHIACKYEINAFIAGVQKFHW